MALTQHSEEELTMTRFLGALVLLAAVIIGLGWYLGWFHFSTTTGDDQKTHIDISVDQNKIRGDVEKANDKLRETGQKAKERAGDDSEKSKDGGPRP
jgi:hypothetical protein